MSRQTITILPNFGGCYKNPVESNIYQETECAYRKIEDLQNLEGIENSQKAS